MGVKLRGFLMAVVRRTFRLMGVSVRRASTLL